MISSKPKIIFRLTIVTLFISLLINSNLKASDFAITFNVSHYQNGNNISCHGAHDGSIEAVIVGGTAPYTYSWNTGSFIKAITNLGAGEYTFTVTDANSETISASVELIEPKNLSLDLIISTYEGYNISEQGGSNGWIQAKPNGGSAPFIYNWSTSGTKDKIENLTAGTYSVTLTDANGCNNTGTTTLTEPSLLHVVSITSPLFNGYNVTCKNSNDGSINLTVAGGVPPYKYLWSKGAFVEDPTGLFAGDHSVKITDANDAEVTTSITLTQPTSLKFEATKVQYSNGFNLSCHDCSNGSITVTPVGGVSPFTYSWKSGETTQTISGLSAREYSATITDANGCTSSGGTSLNAPDRDDWAMVGNLNTDPATQFMGTKDNKDFLIKTNNAERIRVSGNGNVTIHGNIKLDSLSTDSVNATFVDQNGNLRVSSSSSSFCNQPAFAFYKKSCPSDPKFYLYGGNGSAARLVLGNPTTTPGNYRMYVTNGILTDKLRIADPTTSFWADYVFEKNYKLQSLQEVKEFISENKHLPNIPTTKEVKENGIDVLEIQGKLLEKIEELTLHLISQEERIKELEELLTKK